MIQYDNDDDDDDDVDESCQFNSDALETIVRPHQLSIYQPAQTEQQQRRPADEKRSYAQAQPGLAAIRHSRSISSHEDSPLRGTVPTRSRLV